MCGRSWFFFFAAWSWIGTAGRSWIVLGESGFQQAVSLIITHAHAHTHCPLWPRLFPAPGWSIGWCLPCDCREREKKRRREKVCGVCVCVLAACPSKSISVSYPWAVPDLWSTLLSIGSWSSFFVGVWKRERHIEFYPLANRGLGPRRNVKSPDLHVPVWGGSNSISEK